MKSWILYSSCPPKLLVCCGVEDFATNNCLISVRSHRSVLLIRNGRRGKGLLYLIFLEKSMGNEVHIFIEAFSLPGLTHLACLAQCYPKLRRFPEDFLLFRTFESIYVCKGVIVFLEHFLLNGLRWRMVVLTYLFLALLLQSNPLPHELRCH